MAKAKTNETIDKAIELTQDTAKVTLNAGVKTAEVTEDYIQGLYKVGYDTNVEGLKVVKNYWDATSEIRQDWVKLFAKTGESLIDATAKMEMPTVNDVTDFGKGVYDNVSKTVGNFVPKAKAAGK
jgi:hypothetical protein